MAMSYPEIEAAVEGTQQIAGLRGIWIDSTNAVAVVSGRGVPVDGADGTGAGSLGVGSKYIDHTNGDEYINKGTLEEPLWYLITSSS